MIRISSGAGAGVAFSDYEFIKAGRSILPSIGSAADSFSSTMRECPCRYGHLANTGDVLESLR
jgi:hypothetical protein